MEYAKQPAAYAALDHRDQHFEVNLPPGAGQAMPSSVSIEQGIQLHQPVHHEDIAAPGSSSRSETVGPSTMYPSASINRDAQTQLPIHQQCTAVPASSSKDQAGPPGAKKAGKKNPKKAGKAKKTAPKGGVQKQTGRKKIKIEYMPDNRARQVSFLKRKNGVLKKAYELSVLTGCETAVVIFSKDNQKLYEFMSATGEQTLNQYAEYTGPSERRLCLTVGDEGFTGTKKSKAGSSSKGPNITKACVKNKAASSSRTSKPAKDIAKNKHGSASNTSNAVNAVVMGGATVRSPTRPVQSIPSTAQLYGAGFRTGVPGRGLQYDQTGFEHETVQARNYYGPPSTLHSQGALRAVEVEPIAMENTDTTQNTQKLTVASRTDTMNAASRGFPVEDQLQNRTSNVEVGIPQFQEGVAPLPAEDQVFLDFLEAEVAIDGTYDTGVVTQAMHAFEEADMFFPAGSARGAPLVFPTLSENLGGFGQFERELEVAPFISPPTSVSGNIDLAGVSLHDLPTAEHEVQTNEQLPPTDLSRFAKS